MLLGIITVIVMSYLLYGTYHGNKKDGGHELSMILAMHRTVWYITYIIYYMMDSYV